ncbi:MAG TPA: aminofutalosine synthase MqnE [Nitrospirota bacterium]|nr:aminofutalosine synthase MqnE [Nitrospirota bacterium]
MEKKIEKIKEKVFSNRRLTRADGIALFRSNDLLLLGRMASHVAHKKNGDRVFFVRNMHINPTNICVNRCKFCAFSKTKGDPGAYAMSIEDILRKARTAQKGVSEFHIVSGLHPDLPFSWYLDMLRALRKEFPKIHLKAFTAVEVDYFSKISGFRLTDTFRNLIEAGLGSMPGGGAEIFDTGVRKTLCAEKITGERWLKVIETAHNAGLKTNATMLYGHIESYEHRVDHLIRLRDLQDKTGGFQAFIPLSFQPKNSEIKKSTYTTGFDDLKTLAVSRLMLDNFDHIKSYWVMHGEKIAQVSMSFGVNDLDGTVVEERIAKAAGGITDGSMTQDEIISIIKHADRIPVERDTLYNVVKVWG